MTNSETQAARLRRELAEARERIAQLEREVTPLPGGQVLPAASDEHLQLLTRRVKDVLWVLRLSDLHFTYVSPSVEQLSGYLQSEALDLGLDVFLSPEDLPAMRAALGQALERAPETDVAEAPSRTFEATQVCKDGSTVPIEIVATLVRDAQDRPEALVGVTRDISERKQAEEARALLEAQLRQAQKMEAVGLLAGGVAHDFSNVLCAILGNASLTLRQLVAADPMREQIEEIVTAAERAAELTRQLLAFSRKQVIEPQVVDLGQLIENLHRMLVRVIGEDIVLRTLPQQGLGRTRVDPGQIEQIVLNLAVNARDAMPEGGELIIETADVVLDDDYCERHGKATAGAHVMIAVSDTGSGMNAELRERIFEPFFTTKQLGQGTGLGLATVLGIVEQSGGRIEVYSEPGQGSCFKVYFPRVVEQIEPTVPPPAAEPGGGHETVLVVEDEEMVRRLAATLLESLGYQVLAVPNGAAALQLVEQHEGPVDLLLTDVVMPHMNGRELAKRLTERHPEIAVLFTSGYTQNVIAHHGVLDEGVEFVAKPYSIDTLARRVREVLDSAHRAKR